MRSGKPMNAPVEGYLKMILSTVCLQRTVSMRVFLSARRSSQTSKQETATQLAGVAVEFHCVALNTL